MPRYQTIVALQGTDAQEALDAYRHGGGREVADLLSEYDDGTAGVSSEVSLAAGPDDETMRVGDYLVIVNAEEEFVALELLS